MESHLWSQGVKSPDMPPRGSSRKAANPRKSTPNLASGKLRLENMVKIHGQMVKKHGGENMVKSPSTCDVLAYYPSVIYNLYYKCIYIYIFYDM